MRNDQSRLGSIVCWIVLVMLVLSTACTPAAAPSAVAPAEVAAGNAPAPATATLEKAVEVPTATEAAANTASPTTVAPETSKAEQATPLPATSTPQPTSAATEAGSEVTAQTIEGFSAWCLPLNSSLSLAKEPLKPPKTAKQSTFANNVLQVYGLPATGCMFLVTYGKTAPTGLSLEVYEINQTTPFFKTNLQPVEGSPETLYAFVQHGAIASPGRATTSFTVAVKDPLGQIQQKADLKLNSWVQGAVTPQPNEDENCGCDVPVLP